MEKCFKNECLCGAVYDIIGDVYRFLGVKKLGVMVKSIGE